MATRIKFLNLCWLDAIEAGLIWIGQQQSEVVGTELHHLEALWSKVLENGY